MNKNIELTVEQLEERVEFTVAVAGGELSQLASAKVEPIKCGFRIVGSCSGLTTVDASSINTAPLTSAELQTYQSILH